MIIQDFEYINILKDCFEHKQKKNPAFSLRSFSKFLGLHDTMLSLLFNRRRHIPEDKGADIAEKLKLDETHRGIFLKSLSQAHCSINKLGQFKVDDDIMLIEEHNDDLNYRIISNNIYFTTLAVLDICSKVSEKNKMSKMLKISLEDLDKILADLISAGYVNEQDGIFFKVSDCFQTPANNFSLALKNSFHEGLECAREALDTLPLEMRHFSSETFIMSEEQMEQAKNLVREFNLKFARILEGEAKTKDKKNLKAYMFFNQFFPLTNNFEE